MCSEFNKLIKYFRVHTHKVYEVRLIRSSKQKKAELKKVAVTEIK